MFVKSLFKCTLATPVLQLPVLFQVKVKVTNFLILFHLSNGLELLMNFNVVGVISPAQSKKASF